MPLPQRGSTATAIVSALKALPPSVDDKVLGVRVLQWEAQLYGRVSTEHEPEDLERLLVIYIRKATWPSTMGAPTI